MKNLGIYIHVPFCMSKCNYCGFYSKPYSVAGVQSYVDEMVSNLADFESWAPEQVIENLNERKVDSVFFGGGTPSLLTENQIDTIMKAIHREFLLEENIEVTMECNPTSIAAYNMKGYKKAGINRISLGCQSFNDDELKLLGRTHCRQSIYDTVESIRDSDIDNLNLDLIFSIPGQSMDSWVNTLHQIINIAPEHVSLYSLQLEEGTDFFRRFEDGSLKETEDDLDRKMYHMAEHFLKIEGYSRYEISNWSKVGYACRHNLKYWQLEDYLGLGPTASSYVEGSRFTLDKSMRKFSEYKENSTFDDASELAFTSLRLETGINFKYFREKIGVDFWKIYDSIRKDLIYEVKEGNLIIDDESIRLTRQGIDISNRIMAMLV